MRSTPSIFLACRATKSLSKLLSTFPNSVATPLLIVILTLVELVTSFTVSAWAEPMAKVEMRAAATSVLIIFIVFTDSLFGQGQITWICLRTLFALRKLRRSRRVFVSITSVKRFDGMDKEKWWSPIATLKVLLSDYQASINRIWTLKSVYPDTKNPGSYQSLARGSADEYWRRDYSVIP